MLNLWVCSWWHGVFCVELYRGVAPLRLCEESHWEDRLTKIRTSFLQILVPALGREPLGLVLWWTLKQAVGVSMWQDCRGSLGEK